MQNCVDNLQRSNTSTLGGCVHRLKHIAGTYNFRGTSEKNIKFQSESRNLLFNDEMGYSKQHLVDQVLCWRCGRSHPADLCPIRYFKCDDCDLQGHSSATCTRDVSEPALGLNIEQKENPKQAKPDGNSMNISQHRPYTVRLLVDKSPIIFVVDTSSSISTINIQMYKKHLKHLVMKKNFGVRSSVGDGVRPLGYITVVVHKETEGTAKFARRGYELHLFVIPGGSLPLLGHTWLQELKPSSIKIVGNHLQQKNYSYETDRIIQNITREYADVFSPYLGMCRKPISLELKDNEPFFVKAYDLPFALREPVQKKLEHLVRDGVIKKVDHSAYGTPIVPVIKKCGCIRICGDYKITINPKLKTGPYPFPHIEEMHAALSGGVIFSNIDLSDAYKQTVLEEDSQALTAINTHAGTFVFIRTPYGLNCTPGKIQKILEEAVIGLPKTVAHLNGIVIAGNSIKDHVDKLRCVFERLQKFGLRVKLSKCDFFKSKFSYLGHIIDASGLHRDKKKIQGMTNAPTPKDVRQLNSLFGIVNYYDQIVPRLSTLLHPLCQLLKKESQWNWTPECESAFTKIKSLLSSVQLVANYDPSSPLIMSVDCSAYGIGAILAHKYKDGSEKPVCYTSRILYEIEKSYSQVDKVALAIYFGVTKYHQYLYGKRFTIRTEHKSLLYIFGDKLGIPQTAANGLQRYADRLARYDFSVELISSAQNTPANCLSRLPALRKKVAHIARQNYSYLALIKKDFPASIHDVANATINDPILSKIYKYISFGWPDTCDNEKEKPYFELMHSLFIESGCIVYNYRIAIPTKSRKHVLYELYAGQLAKMKNICVTEMKNITCNYVYWPGLHNEIKELCSQCDDRCQQGDAQTHNDSQSPSQFWQRLNTKFGVFKGLHYLIVVDTHSKWTEISQTKQLDAKTVIATFREMFSRFGLPQKILTDNETPFNLSEVQRFFSNNSIEHNYISSLMSEDNAMNSISKYDKKIEETRSVNGTVMSLWVREGIGRPPDDRTCPATRPIPFDKENQNKSINQSSEQLQQLTVSNRDPKYL